MIFTESGMTISEGQFFLSARPKQMEPSLYNNKLFSEYNSASFPSKIFLPICWVVSGILMFVRFLQSLNAFPQISVNDDGRETSVNAVQPSNAKG